MIIQVPHEYHGSVNDEAIKSSKAYIFQK